MLLHSFFLRILKLFRKKRDKDKVLFVIFIIFQVNVSDEMITYLISLQDKSQYPNEPQI